MKTVQKGFVQVIPRVVPASVSAASTSRPRSNSYYTSASVLPHSFFDGPPPNPSSRPFLSTNRVHIETKNQQPSQSQLPYSLALTAPNPQAINNAQYSFIPCLAPRAPQHATAATSAAPSTVDPLAGNESGPPLHFDVGAYGIPKRNRRGTPKKPSDGGYDLGLSVQVGEDAYFICDDAIGVADGVGGWSRVKGAESTAALLPAGSPSPSALFARRLMHFSADEADHAKRRRRSREAREKRVTATARRSHNTDRTSAPKHSSPSRGLGTTGSSASRSCSRAAPSSRDSDTVARPLPSSIINLDTTPWTWSDLHTPPTLWTPPMSSSLKSWPPSWPASVNAASAAAMVDGRASSTILSIFPEDDRSVSIHDSRSISSDNDECSLSDDARSEVSEDESTWSDDELEEVGNGIDVLMILERAYERTLAAHVVPSSSSDNDTRSGKVSAAEVTTSDDLATGVASGAKPTATLGPPPAVEPRAKSRPGHTARGYMRSVSMSSIEGRSASTSGSSKPKETVPLLAGSSTALVAVLDYASADHASMPSGMLTAINVATSGSSSTSATGRLPTSSFVNGASAASPSKPRTENSHASDSKATMRTKSHKQPHAPSSGTEKRSPDLVTCERAAALHSILPGPSRQAVVKVAHVGDCVAMLVRSGAIVWRSDEMWWAWNTPVQLGPRRDCAMRDSPSPPSCAVDNAAPARPTSRTYSHVTENGPTLASHNYLRHSPIRSSSPIPAKASTYAPANASRHADPSVHPPTPLPSKDQRTLPVQARTYIVPIQADDILILASDGLSDNLWDEDILDEVVRFQRSFLGKATEHPSGEAASAAAPATIPVLGSGGDILRRRTLAGMLSEALCSRARRASLVCSTEGKSVGSADAQEVPFARRARENGRAFSGGKRDDISVVVAVISPNSPHPSDL